MPLTGLAVYDGPQNMDGLVLYGWDGGQRITAFISRRVMDCWAYPKRPYNSRESLFRAEYIALGKSNLSAIERIVSLKYERGHEFNRQHPFVDVLLADIVESEETLDLRDLG